MKLKEKFQRFWTLSKSRKGFTLVELIVVIAILAILAGVAIPVYNGYIKKAESAADQQLLDTINTAFAAAYLTEGYNTRDAQGSYIQINGDGVLAQVAAIHGGKDVSTVIMPNFMVFYEGNQNSVFKGSDFVGKRINIDADGSFKVGAGTSSVNFRGNSRPVNTDSIVALFGSDNNFKGSISTLQERIDSLAGAFEQVYLGNKNNLADPQIKALLGDNYLNYIANVPDAQVGNATVLYIAEQTKNMTADSAMKLMNDVKNSDDPFAVLQSSGTDPLAAVALMYGSAAAYANTLDENDPFRASVNGVTDLATLKGLVGTMITDEDGFMTYFGNEQHKTDVGGYIGALDIIDSVSGDLTKEDLENDKLWDSNDIDAFLAELQKNANN